MDLGNPPDREGTVAAIELRGLTKIYGDDPRRGLDLLRQSDREQLLEKGYVVAVDNVDLTISPGEIFVVMGLSGSGKSTLLRCINRLIEPTAGSVLIEGKDIIGLSKAELLRLRVEKLGMVFQHFGLFPHLSVLDNVAFGLRVKGLSKRERREQAALTLQLVGLAGWETKKPHQLSGGMQQRVGLARALCLQPPILLMDEPFGSLDPLIREEMQRELLRLQHQLQKTVLFITHDLHEAIQIGSRIAIFRQGRMVQMGTPFDIIATPRDEYVSAFVRDVNILKILTLRHALDATVATVKDGHSWSGNGSAVIIDRHDRPVAIARNNSNNRNSRFLALPETAALDASLAQIAASPGLTVAVDSTNRYVGSVTPQSIIIVLASRGGLKRSPPSVNGVVDKAMKDAPNSSSDSNSAKICEIAAAANLRISSDDLVRLASSARVVSDRAGTAAAVLNGDKACEPPIYRQREND